MKFSTRLRYGIRTMLEIGLNYEIGGVLEKDISANQEIPLKTLDHLIQALKTADLITNVNGKKVGYTLRRHPSKITMFDIQRAIEPALCCVDCISPIFHATGLNYVPPRISGMSLMTKLTTISKGLHCRKWFMIKGNVSQPDYPFHFLKDKRSGPRAKGKG